MSKPVVQQALFDGVLQVEALAASSLTGGAASTTVPDRTVKRVTVEAEKNLILNE
jgi:hypothetical protein